MAAFRGYELTDIPLEEVAGKTKIVPVDHPLIDQARSIDTCFGDRLPDMH
jgi:6-phosphofructokinase 1